MAGLGDFGQKYPYELSGGMQHRASIVRALVHDPKLLIMDEPFAALDAITRDVLHEELVRIRQSQQLTVVFVTHNVREAVRLGDHVALLSSRPGRLVKEYDVQIGQPRRIESPEVASLSVAITDDLRAEIRKHGGQS
jgi:NitT/TauT family transport system ATP-binding protein